MTEYRVIVTPTAQEMIAEAFAYILRRSEHNAQRWLRDLYRTIATLRSFPTRCGIAREADLLGRPLRQLIFKSHRIIFEVKASTVFVLFVRHAAQRAIGELPRLDDPDDDDDR